MNSINKNNTKQVGSGSTSPSIIERLFLSFSDLEESIEGAKKTLASKQDVPAHVFERLSSYDGIISKQRRLATKLAQLMAKGEWDEVGRHVSLINGLSSMIRDDARSILSSLSLNSDNRNEADIVNFEKLPVC
jgi:hypothetical protein